MCLAASSGGRALMCEVECGSRALPKATAWVTSISVASCRAEDGVALPLSR